jgi:1,4-dihydroxy-2-naphthoyl-CoA synthase
VNGTIAGAGWVLALLEAALLSDTLTSETLHALAEEATATALISQTHDRIEGVKALVEGRAPEFTGD